MDITSELLIQAPVERVWDLTIDIEGWPELTPTMTDVERLDEGPLRVGSTARVVQPRQRPTVWTVTELVPYERFVWEAKVVGATMRAVHELSPRDGGCRNCLSVELDGFGSGLLSRLVGSRIRQAIATENEGFLAAAEASVRSRRE